MEEKPLAILERLLSQPVRVQNMHCLRSHDLWGTFATNEQLRAAEAEFAAAYREVVAEVQVVWGPPAFSGDFDSPAFPRWCPAAELSYWRKGSRLACIWWEHQDNDAPVALVLHVAADTESGGLSAEPIAAEPC